MITEKDIDENSMTGDLIHSIFFFIIHITIKNFFGTMYSSNIIFSVTMVAILIYIQSK